MYFYFDMLDVIIISLKTGEESLINYSINC